MCGWGVYVPRSGCGFTPLASRQVIGMAHPASRASSSRPEAHADRHPRSVGSICEGHRPPLWPPRLALRREVGGTLHLYVLSSGRHVLPRSPSLSLRPVTGGTHLRHRADIGGHQPLRASPVDSCTGEVGGTHPIASCVLRSSLSVMSQRERVWLIRHSPEPYSRISWCGHS